MSQAVLVVKLEECSLLSVSLESFCIELGFWNHGIMRSGSSGIFILIIVVASSSEASVPPKISGFMVPETSIGSETILMCTLGSGTKPVKFSWTKDGQELPSNIVTHTPASSTVYIPVVKSQDRGKYSCRVKSSFGEDSKSADLVVSGKLPLGTLPVTSNFN